jgi:hypothetical protein
MSDLDEIFTAYRSGGPLAPAPGVEAVRSVARRRRAARAAGLGALAAVVVATSAVAAVRLDRPLPDPPVTSPTPVPAPSVSTGRSAPPSPTPSSASPPPDGRISRQQLGNATLDLPAWSGHLDDECPDGPVRFSGGTARRSATAELAVRISDVVHADLDDDDATETAALIGCSGLETGESRVVAFDRTADGRVRTLGTVVAETGDIAAIREIRPVRDAVEARVADFAGDGLPDDLAQVQWRRYAWRDGRFRQAGGPSDFPPNPRITDLAVTGADLRLTPAGDERAAGTLRLTVRNDGPHPAAVLLQVTLPKPFDVRTLPAGCTRAPSNASISVLCRLPSTAAGRTTPVELAVSVPLGRVGTGIAGRYRAEVSSPADINRAPYPEPTGRRADNSIERDLVIPA